jgi:hypothetical protein
MQMNRDEFLLLSRQGRVPPAVRAGPGRRPVPEPFGRPAPGGRGRLGAGVARALASVAARVRARLRDPLRGRRRIDAESYRELEFPVAPERERRARS